METLKNLWNKLVGKVGRDKLLHFGIAFLIVFILGILFGEVIGLSVGLIAILGKEAYDEFSDGTGWDWKDVLTGLIGTVAALLLI